MWWVLPVGPTAVTESRHRASEFAAAAGASDDVIEAIGLAVSETVTNVVLHAYRGGPGQVRVNCRVEGARFIVEVIDDGSGIAARPDSPGIGHGLAIVGALASTLDIATAPDGRGTAVTMGFDPGPPPEVPPGMEVLCGLALETVADVSNVDVVHEGVLRRVAAEVAGDPGLTAWLSTAVPPAKPGTATWAALREGGARLVVHDPNVPRSPGGTGERLDLMWWVAVALQTPDGTPVALWGWVAGRAGAQCRPRRSSTSSPLRRGETSRSPPSERCSAHGWRQRPDRTADRKAAARRAPPGDPWAGAHLTRDQERRRSAAGSAAR